MLRTQQEVLLNCFRAKGEISAGAVEGLDNKIRVVTRRSYGLRTYDAMEIVLYHTLDRLPEPESTHRFGPARVQSGTSPNAYQAATTTRYEPLPFRQFTDQQDGTFWRRHY
jgi:hypothetical protein